MEEVSDTFTEPSCEERAHHDSSHQETSRIPQLWENVSSGEWNDWKWQLSHRIFTLEKLQSLIRLTKSESEAILMSRNRFPMAITPYFASLLDPLNPKCPLRLQCIPRKRELVARKNDMLDPCGEEQSSVVSNLVHRYPDRVLLLVTTKCAVYCRYCTRRRVVGSREINVSHTNLEIIYDYLRKNKQIRDVLISGGDPFLLEDDHLEAILKNLWSIRHIEIVRIGTRVPVTLPMRVTEKFATMLRRYHPLFVSLHFSHPKEITSEVSGACRILADVGIPLGSQTVLLRGINEKPSIMKELVHKLLMLRVRPYYLYQCDPAVGTDHFRTPISVGIKIIESLEGFTTGYAVPRYVIDAPGGGGKISMGPNHVISHEDGEVILKNYLGKIYQYHEPGK